LVGTAEDSGVFSGAKREFTMQTEVFEKLRALKQRYGPEGFIIIGVFGSYAHGEEGAHSDIDILYRCHPSLLQKYRGWAFFDYYQQVKIELEQTLGCSVDLADESALNAIGKKYSNYLPCVYICQKNSTYLKF
jgi:uncharacterized protein